MVVVKSNMNKQHNANSSHGKHVGRAAKAHPQQPSRALMRHAVSRPKPGLKRQLRAQSHIAKQPSAELAVKPSISAIDSKRLRRAQRISQNKLVSRFGRPQPPQFTPVAITTPATVTPTVGLQSSLTSPIKPARTTRQPRQARTTADILQQALDQASSHQQPPIKLKRSWRRGRITGLSAWFSS